MIPFFVGYAMLVWWPCAVFRRRWASFVAAALGTLGMMAIIEVHRRIGIMTEGRIFTPVLRTMLIPYMYLVGGVGLYISVLPRNPPLGHCGRCGYDLCGQTEAHWRCPECGHPYRREPETPPS